METTQFFPASHFPKCDDAAPGTFIVHEAASACPFDRLDGLRAADAEEGGLAKLLTVRLADGQMIAVKRFHAARELDEPLFNQHAAVAREEFCRMVELNGANGHAPYVYALGSCYDDRGCEHPAIAMQFIDGFTLEYALKAGLISGAARKTDKTRSIMEVGLHIARALAACKQVSHRDLNPRNVMLIMDRWGKVQRAVLIDFGQAIASANPLVTPSAQPHRLATVSFGAPEIYGGPFYFMRNNPSVDVYSLGALIYYLRTRSIPFLQATTLDPTTSEGARDIVAAKRSPVNIAGELSSSLRGIDQQLHQIAYSCTAFDPRDRPAIEDVISRLEETLGAGRKQPEATDGAGEEKPSIKPARIEPEPAATKPAATKPAPTKPAPIPAASETSKLSPAELLQLADDYFYGHGGKTRSKQLSLSHLTRAAEAGSSTAQLKLGRSLALGQHGIIDAAKARYWLEKAASAGHPGAAATLRTLAA